jgi:hypothetical protein
MNQQTADLRLASFDSLVFALDYLYGLKQTRGVDTYYDLINGSVLKNIVSLDTTANTGAYAQVIYGILDELHSSFNEPSVYAPPSAGFTLTLADLGPRVAAWYEGYWAVQGYNGTKAATFGDGKIPPVRFSGNTAIIYFESFVTATVDDPDGEDSDKMMKAVMAEIIQHPEITNIVVDISYNTGGNVGALLRVLGYMTDDLIEYTGYNALTGSGYIEFIGIDTNDDDSYEDDAYDSYNWFILSSSVTFSAANAMVTFAKQIGCATIIGQKSGGGGSSILPVILADGTSIIISSNSTIALATPIEDGYAFSQVESGVTVDYTFPLASFYNDAALTEFINSLLD